MLIRDLDHINIRTARLDEMVAWYEARLGLTRGSRPDFGFPGAWLYAGDRALVHLVGVDREPASDGSDLKLEHGAFRAAGYSDFVASLRAAGEAFHVADVPGMDIVQVNVWDPDGNHLHLDFDAAEVDGPDRAG